jgi:hypothetical protein
MKFNITLYVVGVVSLLVQSSEAIFVQLEAYYNPEYRCLDASKSPIIIRKCTFDDLNNHGNFQAYQTWEIGNYSQGNTTGNYFFALNQNDWTNRTVLTLSGTDTLTYEHIQENANQTWYLKKYPYTNIGTNRYHIINKESGKCMQSYWSSGTGISTPRMRNCPTDNDYTFGWRIFEAYTQYPPITDEPFKVVSVVNNKTLTVDKSFELSIQEWNATEDSSIIQLWTTQRMENMTFGFGIYPQWEAEWGVPNVTLTQVYRGDYNVTLEARNISAIQEFYFRRPTLNSKSFYLTSLRRSLCICRE